MTENSPLNSEGGQGLSSDVVQRAVASLAMRVAKLEKEAPTLSHSGDGSDMRPSLSATLAELKALRTTLLTSSSDVDEKFKELDSVKKENAKLKYQIKHLVRSLEAEEKCTQAHHST